MQWVQLEDDRHGIRYVDQKVTCKDVASELRDVVIDDFSLDRWHKYWMDVVDTRGVYLCEREDFLMSGGITIKEVENMCEYLNNKQCDKVGGYCLYIESIEKEMYYDCEYLQ